MQRLPVMNMFRNQAQQVQAVEVEGAMNVQHARSYGVFIVFV